MRIAFYDSGIGGLTVFYLAYKLRPNYHYIYFSDAKNAPYGIKLKQQVKDIVIDVVDYLYNLNIDALVVACNTATAVAINDIRNKYSIPIIGMEPAVKPAVEIVEPSLKVLVTATPLTLKEEKFNNLVHKVDPGGIVEVLPLPKLVEFAEEENFDFSIVSKYLIQELSKFNLQEIGTLVLGCTHFPYFYKIFKEVLPSHIKIIDGNLGTVKNLFHKIDNLNKPNSNISQIDFYISKEKQKDISKIHKYFSILEENYIPFIDTKID